mmetsp:Transcript_25736/g.60066  ORF Transcript_25736/g.60066 Transcript_25736/m.60066 type:complete len:604 (-) Transcript_25736:24-1835(-)
MVKMPCNPTESHSMVSLALTAFALSVCVLPCSGADVCLLQQNVKAAWLSSGTSVSKASDASSSTAGIVAPNTVGWDPEVLVRVRELLEDSVPEWATAAAEQLQKSADSVVSLPAGLRSGVGAGPWSLTAQGPNPPPPGSPRDYHTVGVYLWPCNVPCPVELFGEAKCTGGAWEAGERVHGTCDEESGLPWVAHDGFQNPGNSDDLNAMVVMMDTLEKLTLAWWFLPEHNQTFAEQAVAVLRTWFLNETTGMMPRLEYGAGVPGKYNGTAGALIAPTFRLNTRLTDCVELLKQASGVWTEADTSSWKLWASAWLDWMETSEFGKIQLNAVGNHATYLFLHKLGMARATGAQSVILDIVAKLRTDFGGSLGEQIVPSGEMPHETARIKAATYSRMNLNGFFQLGKAAENACRGLSCSPAWDWKWEVAENSVAAWEGFENQISKCSHQGSGSTESLEACKDSCTAAASCNTVVTRVKYGNLMGCYWKRCSGTNYQHQYSEPTANVFTSYHLVEGPPVGSGSVRKALDFLLPYALGQKNFSADFQQSIDGGDSWQGLALPLRIAATELGNATYEEYIGQVDPDGDFSSSFESLLFPTVDALRPQSVA